MALLNAVASARITDSAGTNLLAWDEFHEEKIRLQKSTFSGGMSADALRLHSQGLQDELDAGVEFVLGFVDDPVGGSSTRAQRSRDDAVRELVRQLVLCLQGRVAETALAAAPVLENDAAVERLLAAMAKGTARVEALVRQEALLVERPATKGRRAMEVAAFNAAGTARGKRREKRKEQEQAAEVSERDALSRAGLTLIGSYATRSGCSTRFERSSGPTSCRRRWLRSTAGCSNSARGLPHSARPAVSHARPTRPRPSTLSHPSCRSRPPAPSCRSACAAASWPWTRSSG
jgi:hypothetical protein